MRGKRRTNVLSPLWSFICLTLLLCVQMHVRVTSKIIQSNFLCTPLLPVKEVSLLNLEIIFVFLSLLSLHQVAPHTLKEHPFAPFMYHNSAHYGNLICLAYSNYSICMLMM